MWLKNRGQKEEWWEIRLRRQQKALSQLLFTCYDAVPDKEPVKGTEVYPGSRLVSL